MKKIICIIMALLSLTFSVYADGTAFTDVKEGDWYYDYVKATERYIKVYPDGSFRPNEKLTREMAAQILYTLEGDGEKYDGYTFEDVKAGAWYADAVEWLYQNGYTAGISEDRYGVGEYITRQDLICLIYRVHQVEWESYKGGDRKYMTSGSLESFKDRDDIADYAKTPMLFACKLAFVITGSEQWAMVECNVQMLVGHNGQLRPRDHCSRAEASVIFRKADLLLTYYA